MLGRWEGCDGAHEVVTGAREDVKEGAACTELGDHAGRGGAGAQEHDNVGVAQHRHDASLLAQLLQHTGPLSSPARTNVSHDWLCKRPL